MSVRVRPLNRQESSEFFSWRIEANSLVQLDASTRDVDRTRDTKYGLDHIFGPDWTTDRIYEVTTQSLIHKMVAGFNSTVFAYGQTSSGKTHTMRGTPDSPGIIPLAVREAFRLIESNDTREYLIRVSYMEVRHPCTASSPAPCTEDPRQGAQHGVLLYTSALQRGGQRLASARQRQAAHP